MAMPVVAGGVDPGRAQTARPASTTRSSPSTSAAAPKARTSSAVAGQSVRLLHPELAHVPEPGGPVGAGGRHGQDGHLVEGGDLGRLHDRAAQRQP